MLRSYHSLCLAFAVSCLFFFACQKDALEDRPTSTTQYSLSNLSGVQDGAASCETILGFCGVGLAEDCDCSVGDYMPLTRSPFGTETEDANQIYGEAVAFWLPDDDTPGQVNPVFAVTGLLDSNLHFVEWDGNERRVYLRTTNTFQKSLQADAPSVPAAIFGCTWSLRQIDVYLRV